jgi:hypothetical protein
MTLEHRNVRKKHFCPACDHFHQMVNPGMPTLSGVCLLNPPQPFVVGMAPSAQSVIKGSPPEMVPIVRGYYPPVGPTDTCEQWTPRTEGEA